MSTASILRCVWNVPVDTASSIIRVRAHAHRRPSSFGVCVFRRIHLTFTAKVIRSQMCTTTPSSTTPMLLIARPTDTTPTTTLNRSIILRGTCSADPRVCHKVSRLTLWRLTTGAWSVRMAMVLTTKGSAKHAYYHVWTVYGLALSTVCRVFQKPMLRRADPAETCSCFVMSVSIAITWTCVVCIAVFST